MRSVCLLLLALCLAPAAARAQAEAPDADEYAVWSAVLRSAAPRGRTLQVADSAFLLPVHRYDRPDSVAANRMADARFDTAAVRDFIARSGSGARLEAGRFVTDRSILLVRIPRDSIGWASSFQAPQLFFSRPGFDAGRTRAVVYAAVYCGFGCGWGDAYELERAPDGGWRVLRKATVWMV
jgi:hypothetical protein